MISFYEVTDKCIKILKLNPATIVAPAYRKRSIITLYDLILAIVSTSSTEEAAVILNSSKTYVLSYCKTHLKPLFPNKLPNTLWYTCIFNVTGYKQCYGCKLIKPYIDFSTDKSPCKECNATYHLQHRNDNIELYKDREKRYYQENKESIKEKTSIYREENREYYVNYSKEHYHNNKSKYFAYNAKRRADKIKATPSWANLEIIKRVYDCAEGDHVDHIIPLKGDLVCGLHVENNLQYLSPDENLRKSNKFVIQNEI